MTARRHVTPHDTHGRLDSSGRSAATDPTEIPASCQTASAQPTSPATEPVQVLLTRAGEQANAHNFSRTFSDAELTALEPSVR